MDQHPVALVVEDEWFIRVCIVDDLANDGWHVLEAGSAEHAIAILEQIPRQTTVSVLFTDIQLSGALDGWDVAHAARRVDPDIAVIYTSGGSCDHDRCVEGYCFFPKPYRAEDVVGECRRSHGLRNL